MAEGDHPLYCTQCGSAVQPGDNFCETCGARVVSNVGPEAAPAREPAAQEPVAQEPVAQEPVAQVDAPPAGAPSGGRGRTVALIVGAAVVLLLVLGIGSVAVLSFLRGETATDGGESPGASQSQESAEKRPTQEDSGPAPGYDLVQAPNGSLTVEAPSGWEFETGEDSEKEAGSNTWSYYAGEYLTSSITTAPSLDAWYGGGTSGAYLVASKSLAQYSDYELTHSLFNANKSTACTQGPYEDLNRPPLSGKIQTWNGCGVDNATTFSVAAAPEGRPCVVVLSARISEDADREAIEHLIGTFEVDCGRVTSEALALSPVRDG